METSHIHVFSKDNNYDFGEIDYSEVRQITDQLGVGNYTFRINHHPDDDYYTFHNLVLNEHDGNMKIYLVKYKMSKSTASKFHENNTLEGFEGDITTSNFGGGGLDPNDTQYRRQPM